MEEITGYPAGELLEMKMEDSRHPDDLPLMLDRYDKRIKNENPGSLYIPDIHKSGGNMAPKVMPRQSTGRAGLRPDMLMI